jgi:(1->4)-alpha-D-glucan 1-alpha-D-glucosylmutase
MDASVPLATYRIQFNATFGFCDAIDPRLPLLRIACPGVADCYQGSELWDLRLVDPDNRGPVDFAKRADMLNRLASELAKRARPAKTMP